MQESKLEERLEKLLDKADSFEYRETYGSNSEYAEQARFEAWITDCSDLLERFFRAGSSPHELSTKATSAHLNIQRSGGREAFQACIEFMKTALQHGLNAIGEDRHQTSVPDQGEVVASDKVFVVHGHDAGLKAQVARFVGELDLEPVVLSEQASGGSQTIIEKIEEHDEVGFAVVLLTPDDVGTAKTAIEEAEDEEAAVDALNHRARQNVVFEMGYFMARLGRERVVGLYKGDLELPSDYQGVVYIDADNEAEWQRDLALELREAGLEVDLNVLAT